MSLGRIDSRQNPPLAEANWKKAFKWQGFNSIYRFFGGFEMEFSGGLFLAGAFLMLLLFSGCTEGQNPAVGDAMEKDGEVVGNDSMKEKPDGMAGSANTESDLMTGKSSYVPFTKAAYGKAKSEGKVIFLEFYANWCPYCAEQKPINEAAFASVQMPVNVAGFQVNYRDSETDADEEALAREFGITYQHSRVILKADGSVSTKSTGNISEEELIESIRAAGA